MLQWCKKIVFNVDWRAVTANYVSMCIYSSAVYKYSTNSDGIEICLYRTLSNKDTHTVCKWLVRILYYELTHDEICRSYNGGRDFIRSIFDLMYNEAVDCNRVLFNRHFDSYDLPCYIFFCHLRYSESRIFNIRFMNLFNVSQHSQCNF